MLGTNGPECGLRAGHLRYEFHVQGVGGRGAGGVGGTSLATHAQTQLDAARIQTIVISIQMDSAAADECDGPVRSARRGRATSAYLHSTLRERCICYRQGWEIRLSHRVARRQAAAAAAARRASEAQRQAHIGTALAQHWRAAPGSARPREWG